MERIIPGKIPACAFEMIHWAERKASPTAPTVTWSFKTFPETAPNKSYFSLQHDQSVNDHLTTNDVLQFKPKDVPGGVPNYAASVIGDLSVDDGTQSSSIRFNNSGTFTLGGGTYPGKVVIGEPWVGYPGNMTNLIEYPVAKLNVVGRGTTGKVVSVHSNASITAPNAHGYAVNANAEATAAGSEAFSFAGRAIATVPTAVAYGVNNRALHTANGKAIAVYGTNWGNTDGTPATEAMYGGNYSRAGYFNGRGVEVRKTVEFALPAARRQPRAQIHPKHAPRFCLRGVWM